MGRDIHLQDPEEHACRWRKDLEVKIVVDARAAQRAGCKFRKTGNLVWLTSQPIPNRAILRYEAWDDLPRQAGSTSSKVSAEEGLWEPKQELWVNQEDPNMPVEITHTWRRLQRHCPKPRPMSLTAATSKLIRPPSKSRSVKALRRNPDQESEGEVRGVRLGG